MQNQTLRRFGAILRRGTVRGCVLTVAMLMLFFLIMTIDAAHAGKTEPGMNFVSLLTIAGFSFVIAFAHEIFSVVSLPVVGRWILHFLLIGLAYFFVILRSRQMNITGAGTYITGLILYLLAYLVAVGAALLLRYLVRKIGGTPGKNIETPKKDDKDDKYKSMFS